MKFRDRTPQTVAPAYPMTEDLPKFPATPASNMLDNAVVAHQNEAESHATKAAKIMGIAATIIALKAGAFVGTDITRGIHEGKERVKSDHPEVHEIYDYVDADPIYRHHGTFVLTGLGTKNAQNTADSLKVHREVGSVFAIEYSNKDLNTADIARRIIERARIENITEISLDGYSMGGPIALDIAAHIKEDAEELAIISVILNSSPVGDNSLTERSASSVKLMERILSLHEDLVYYENGRIGVELFARSDRYLRQIGQESTSGFKIHGWNKYSYDGILYEFDLGSFKQELDSIREKMQNPDVADANLITKQADILKLNFEDKIKKLDDTTLIVYTRSLHADSDPVVDIDTSEKNLVDALERDHKTYMVLREPVQHANPTERHAEYSSMIRDRIHPAITNKLIVQMLRRLTAKQPLDDSFGSTANNALTPTFDPTQPN